MVQDTPFRGVPVCSFIAETTLSRIQVKCPPGQTPPGQTPPGHLPPVVKRPLAQMLPPGKSPLGQMPPPHPLMIVRLRC